MVFPTTSVPSRALLLNASHDPLCLVTMRRAVSLVLADKATVLESDGRSLHSARTAIPLPLVICLTRYIHVPYRRTGQPTRRTVLHRDHYRCAYCLSLADTIDHVVPRSRGGGHDWGNVVAACASCNRRKADRLLEELGWHLRFAPSVPSGAMRLIIGGATEPAWSDYLAG